MNKAEFISLIADRAGVTKSSASNMLEVILTSIKEAVAQNGELRFVNFGSFRVSKYPAKIVKNPRNKEVINVPAGKRPRFVPGKEFRELVNNGS